MRRCFIFAAGSFFGLRERPAPDDLVIAADAGYRLCRSLGAVPDLALGDFDSMDDLCDSGALIAKIKHSTIAHGFVKSVDTSEAETVPGVVKILTCFDAPDRPFPTAGHPWSMPVGGY